MFLSLVALTALVCVFYASRVWLKTGDIYHPVMFFVPMLSFLYVLQPIELILSNKAGAFFTESQLIQIHLVSLTGMTALLAGANHTRAPRRGLLKRPKLAIPTQNRIRIASLILGSLGIVLWLKTLIHQGGLGGAFGTSYAGGWDDSGYVRDLALYSPMAAALLRIYLCGATTVNARDLCYAGAFSVPMLLQGILGARRGPTFMICAGALCVFDLARGRRPRLTRGLFAGASTAALLLFLITNRSAIYIGSTEKFDTNVQSFLEPGPNTEYMVGGGEILNTEQTGEIAWGRNWLAEIVIRPIPSAVWPGKWQDYADWTGTRLINAVFHTGISRTIGWQPAVGAPPAIVGETFAEWGPLYLPVLWVLGNAYGRAWRRARVLQGNWPLYYAVWVALSIYIIMQGPLDTIYRFLLVMGMLGVVIDVGKRVQKKARRRAHSAFAGQELAAAQFP